MKNRVQRKEKIIAKIMEKKIALKCKIPDLRKLTTKELIGLHGSLCERMKNE